MSRKLERQVWLPASWRCLLPRMPVEAGDQGALCCRRLRRRCHTVGESVEISAQLIALIVEDEEPVLDEVRNCVERDGRVGTIFTASNVRDAIKILRRESVIDIAFLDVRMPGMGRN